MEDYLDLKSYIISYLEDRKIRYTKLDKHDRAIDLLVNENKELIQTINKAIDYCNGIIEQRIDITDTDYDLGQDSVARDIYKILGGEDNEN